MSRLTVWGSICRTRDSRKQTCHDLYRTTLLVGSDQVRASDSRFSSAFMVFLRSKDACWHHGSFIFVDESCSSNAWKARLAHACLRSIRRHRFPWRKGSASTSTRWTWTHLHLSLSTLYERVVKVAASGGHGIVITSARLCIWQAACYIWVSQPFSANDGMIFGWMIVDAYISPQPVLGLGTKFPPWRHIWPYGQFVTEGGIPGFKGKLSTHLYPQLLIHWNECLQFVLVIYWQE